METQRAIELIAEILDVLVGSFIPDCGGDFVPEYGGRYGEDTACDKTCKYYGQCRRMTRAQELNSELQGLLAGEEWI